MKQLYKLVLTFALILCYSSQISHAELITLRTGNGSINQFDPLISCVKVVDGTPFSSAVFDSARNGVSALIEDDYNNRSDFIEVPGTHWIVNEHWKNGCALYAQEFTITDNFTSATLNFSYSVDNYLGSTTLPGLYINGQAIIPASANQGTYTTVSTIQNIDITQYIVQGSNVLYSYQYDFGYGAGISYLAQITTIPEPASLALFGLSALIARRKKTK